MKRVYLFLSTFLISLLFMISCSQIEKKKPVTQPPVVVVPPVVVSPPVGVKDIIAMAKGSQCASYSWKSRSKSPAGYIPGMAIMYARELCNPHKIVSDPSLGESTRDGLTYMGLEGGSESVYTLLAGLGMRESSGKHCEGRDMSAKNTSADTAEAGMFQTSFNSRVADLQLTAIFQKYKAGGQKCYLEVFSEGVTCSASNWSNYGSSDGTKFQELSKSCPAFAVEYASVMMRVRRNHYGPINRKEVEIKKECRDLFSQVESLVKSQPGICELI